LNIHFNDESEAFGYLISYSALKNVVLDIFPTIHRIICDNRPKNRGKYPITAVFQEFWIFLFLTFTPYHVIASII